MSVRPSHPTGSRRAGHRRRRDLCLAVAASTSLLALGACGSPTADASATPAAPLTPIASQAATVAPADPGTASTPDVSAEVPAGVSADISRARAYLAMADAVFSLDPPPDGFRLPRQFRGLLPAGVRVVSIDGVAATLCVQDTDRSIALDVDLSRFGHLDLLDGTCASGDRRARINAREGRPRFTVVGDATLAAPLLRYARTDLSKGGLGAQSPLAGG